MTSSVGINPTTLSEGFIVNLLDKMKPAIDIEHSSQMGVCFYDNRPFET